MLCFVVRARPFLRAKKVKVHEAMRPVVMYLVLRHCSCSCVFSGLAFRALAILSLMPSLPLIFPCRWEACESSARQDCGNALFYTLACCSCVCVFFVCLWKALRCKIVVTHFSTQSVQRFVRCRLAASFACCWKACEGSARQDRGNALFYTFACCCCVCVSFVCLWKAMRGKIVVTHFSTQLYAAVCLVCFRGCVLEGVTCHDFGNGLFWFP